MNGLIVTTDFSPRSLNAVQYAADYACVTGKSLLLFHHLAVTDNASAAVNSPVWQLEKEAEEKLDTMRKEMIDTTRGRVRIKTKLTKGNFRKELEKVCKDENPFAVVMGSEPSAHADRIFNGAKTLASIRNNSYPILVVPFGARFSKISRIGLASDLKDISHTVPVKEIKIIVQEFNPELHIINISTTRGPQYYWHSSLERTWLKEIVAKYKPRYHFIHDQDIESGILRIAENYKIDLLIIIPKNHGFIKRLFTSSLSKRLVLHSPVPILAIHE